MEVYGKILLFAMPAFLALVLFEKWYGYQKGFDTFRNMDMISSLSSGITNVIKDVLGLAITIISYAWLVDHVALYTIKATWLTYVVAFIVLDFAYYWVHLIMHKVNFFWNSHIIHHSSEEYNLACALRQSISSFFKIFTVFLLPAAFLGVPAQVIAVVAPIHLFAQFWYHTRHIGKMGFIEKILVTPSHHRVHHALNPEYIDKNMSAIFIIWDKLFGTFQEELEEVPPVYGITRPVQTWNPIKINFQHMQLMMMDAWRTNNWKDKFTLWFKPTGYRPADVMERYPVYKIENPYQFEKYETRSTALLNIWSWFQLIVLLLFVSYLFAQIGSLNATDPALIFWYGAFGFFSVYAMTELMDLNHNAFVWEVIKNILGLYLVWKQGDWFGLSEISPVLNGVVIGYLIISGIIVFLICNQFVRNKEFAKT